MEAPLLSWGELNRSQAGQPGEGWGIPLFWLLERLPGHEIKARLVFPHLPRLGKRKTESKLKKQTGDETQFVNQHLGPWSEQWFIIGLSKDSRGAQECLLLK